MHNIQKTEADMFDPKTDRFPYPVDTDRHYLEVKKDKGIVFDENYPYIDESKGFKAMDFLFRVMLRILVFPLVRIRLGLKVNGRENLKKYSGVLDSGFVSVCNHVHMWDYLGLLCAMKPRKARILAWAPNINGENGYMIRHVGGIPIPERLCWAIRLICPPLPTAICTTAFPGLKPAGSTASGHLEPTPSI